MPECSCQSCSGGMPEYLYIYIHIYFNFFLTILLKGSARDCCGSCPLRLHCCHHMHCLCSNKYLNRAINISNHIHPNKKSTTIRGMRQPHRARAAPCSAPLAPTQPALPWLYFPPAFNRHLATSNIHGHTSSYFPNKQKHL